MSDRKTINIKESRCIKCRLCEEVCPFGAMNFEGDNAGNIKRVFNEDQCYRCGLCVDVCPKNVLSFSHKEQGDKLSLCHSPKYQSVDHFPKIRNCPVKVITKKEVAKDIIELTLQIPDDRRFEFLAGQYVDIYYEDMFLRPYSIATSPILLQQKNILKFVIKLVKGGKGSKYLKRLRESSVLKISGPYGTLVHENQLTAQDQVVFISTGTGIAPVLSMAQDLIDKKSAVQILFLFGVRSEQDVFYRDVLEEMHLANKNFNYVYTLSKPAEGWTGHKGRVTDHISNVKTFNDKTRFYICGSPVMIDSCIKILSEHPRINKDYIYYEKFI